jgi:hypothetical protein
MTDYVVAHYDRETFAVREVPGWRAAFLGSQAECQAEAVALRQELTADDRPWGEQQEQVDWLESRYDGYYGEE